MSFPHARWDKSLSTTTNFQPADPANNADLSLPPGPDTRFISRYIDVANDALFPFGHGLSYTQFAYSDVKVSRTALPSAEARRQTTGKLITVTATVKNVGTRAATEVPQCYVRNVGASLEQPVRALKGFRRVTLQPGESISVSFDLGFDELSFFNNEGQRLVEATHYTAWVGGSSTATEFTDFSIQ